MVSTILLFLFRTTLYLAAGGLLCRLILRHIDDRIPRLSRVLWLAVLLSGWFWLQPAIKIPAPRFVDPPVPATPVFPTQAVPLRVEHPKPFFTEPLPFVEPVVHAEWPQPMAVEPVAVAQKFDGKPLILPVLFAVWLGGMVVSIFLAAAGYVRYLSALRNTVPAGDDFAGLWHRLLAEHGIDARTIPMLVSRPMSDRRPEDGGDLGPALIRTLRGYRLVVPHDLWSELPEAGRCGILRHELAHFLRRDVWKSFLVRVLALPHWFNPIAWLAVHRFEEAAEHLCDRAAFDLEQEGAAEFARTLLLLHENAPTQCVVRHSIFGRGLEHRVACLLHKNPKRKVTLMKKTLLISGTVALLAACLFRFEFVERTTTAAAGMDDSPVAISDESQNNVPLQELKPPAPLPFPDITTPERKSAEDETLAITRQYVDASLLAAKSNWERALRVSEQQPGVITEGELIELEVKVIEAEIQQLSVEPDYMKNKESRKKVYAHHERLRDIAKTLLERTTRFHQEGVATLAELDVAKLRLIDAELELLLHFWDVDVAGRQPFDMQQVLAYFAQKVEIFENGFLATYVKYTAGITTLVDLAGARYKLLNSRLVMHSMQSLYYSEAEQKETLAQQKPLLRELYIAAKIHVKAAQTMHEVGRMTQDEVWQAERALENAKEVLVKSDPSINLDEINTDNINVRDWYYELRPEEKPTATSPPTLVPVQ